MAEENTQGSQPVQPTQETQQPVAQAAVNIPARIVSESIVMEVRNAIHDIRDIQTKITVPNPDTE